MSDKLSEQMICAMSGGVGGAKLALGLARVLRPGALAVIANTGDDFDHLGLRIWPDFDTLLYTLADIANPETGWGRAGETWTFMRTLSALGGEDWFQLGDADLAVHVIRTEMLRRGLSASDIALRLTQAFKVEHVIAPATESCVRTVLNTEDCEMPFQDYFVRERCAPIVRGVRYDGAERAQPSPVFRRALSGDCRGFILCPSNPLLSLEPILSITGVRQALRDRQAPLVAVCPIIGGEAVKGPSVKILNELGEDATALGFAARYSDILDAILIDPADSDHGADIRKLGVSVVETPILMTTLDDKKRVANDVLRTLEALA